VIPIIVPPLRDRKKDIPLLVDTFLENLSKQSSEKKKNISENALGLLLDYEWQGNVRELKNLLERLSIMVGKDHINAADIPQPYNPIREPVKLPDKELFIYEDDLSKAKKQFEKDFIKKMIDLESGDLKSAAKKLGTSVKYIKKIIH
jgi:two-component system nitrogen regulation response regulator NtrX